MVNPDTLAITAMVNLLLYIATLARKMKKVRTHPNLSQSSLADACFHATQASGGNERDLYEDLAEERRKLKRQLKEMGEENAQHTPKAKQIKQRIDQIDGKLG